MERPEYRVLVEGQRHFDCKPLRATLSTGACAQRWEAGAGGPACSGCELGRLHHADHHPHAPKPKVQWRASREPCTRCGRTDLRTVSGVGLCVSCANRTYEWLRGCNGKGTHPVKLSLQGFEVAYKHADGRLARRLVFAADPAEALARVLRRLPAGARLASDERRLANWNPDAGEFELVCERCGAQGLIVERERNGVLQRHARCCDGEPSTDTHAWVPAKARRPVVAMHPEAVAAVLAGDAGLAGEQVETWTPTGIACDCGAGQVEGLLTSLGWWRTRCGACRTTHDSAPQRTRSLGRDTNITASQITCQ